MKKYILISLISLLSFCYYGSSIASQTIPILTYHSFAKSSKIRINITPEDFEKHLQCLTDNNYHVIPLEKFIEALNQKLPLPEKSVIITIDDGDKSVYDVAFPLLKKFNLTATLFLTTNFVNKEFNWEKIKIMQESGIIDIQGHTKTHHYQTLVRNLKREWKKDYLKRLKKELWESKTIIEKNLNKKVKYLAYTYGKYDQFVIKKAKEYGYEALLSCHGGVNTLNSDPFNLDRQEIHNNFNLKKFISILNIKPLEVYYLNPPLATFTFYKKPKIFAMIKEPIDQKTFQIVFDLNEKLFPWRYDIKDGKLSLILNRPLIQGVHFARIQLINKNTSQVEKEIGWIFTRQGIPFITVKGVKLFLKIFAFLMIFIAIIITVYKIKGKYVS